MDAQHLFEEQDLRIADLVEREGRALVIAINKWDLVERKPDGITELREQADERLPQVKGVPVVAVSGLTGEGIDRLMTAIRACLRGLEQARLDRPAQSLARAMRPSAQSAAGGVGPAASGSTT